MDHLYRQLGFVIMKLTAIDLGWADGRYTFDLPLKCLRALQDKTGVGPYMVLMRLQSGQWRVDDYRETLFQGLIGGGMAPVTAREKIETYCDGHPAGESLLQAQAVLQAFISGAPDKKPGKGTAAKKKRAVKPETASTLPPSTDTAPSSASPRRKSAK